MIENMEHTDAKQIDAKGKDYRTLNKEIRESVNEGINYITVKNVLGQRFIADGLKNRTLRISIFGVAGGDLGAFMDGPTIYVRGNAEHAPGNTMSSGTIIVDGDAGDCVGHSMRGGKIFVKGSVGYRVGIHMKQFQERFPTIIIGGSAYSFLGEYMAGGIIVVLGQNCTKPVGSYVGTGIHGGTIYVAGVVDDNDLGVAASKKEFTDEDRSIVSALIDEYNHHFDSSISIDELTFTKIQPSSKRPFSNLYTTEG